MVQADSGQSPCRPPEEIQRERTSSAAGTISPHVLRLSGAPLALRARSAGCACGAMGGPWYAVGGEVVRSALATVARSRAQNWRNAPTRAGFTQRPLLAAPSPVPPDGGQPGPRRSECPALAPLARSPAPRRARLTARACAFPPPRLPLSACRRFACCRACRRSGGWNAPPPR